MKYSFLSAINFPEDLRKLAIEQLPQLANELRAYIIDIVSSKKGHLSSGL